MSMWYLILFEIIPWSGLVAITDLGQFPSYRSCAEVQRELVVRIKDRKTEAPLVPICMNIEKMNEKDW